MEKRLLTVAAVLLAVALSPAPAWCQLFDETKISFSLADDNVLRDPGETKINSPGLYFGGQAKSPADRTEPSVYSQPASRLHVFKRLDFGTLSPEGGLKVRFRPDENGNYIITDDGTYLALNFLFGSGAPEASDRKGGRFLLNPVDSDRIRIGTHYDISWGGSNAFPKNFRKGLVPGASLSFDLGLVDFFVAAKTALIRSPSETILDNPGGNTNQFVERTNYGALGGIDVEPLKGLKLSLGGGYFEKGTSARPNTLGMPIDAGGGSARIAYHLGGDVGRRLDLRLYMQDPEKYGINDPLDTSRYMGLDLAFEFAFVDQVLEDLDRFGSTRHEQSKAFALTAGFRFEKLRLHFDMVYRDLTYITFNVPGFMPYQALPGNADLSHGNGFSFLPEALSGEWFSVLAADYHFKLGGQMGLSPALSGGLLLPATYKPGAEGLTIEGPFVEEQVKGIQKVVVRGTRQGDWDILPAGEDEMPVFIGKFDLKFNVGPNYAVVGEVSYANDPNYAQVFMDEQGHAIREFDNPHVLGLGLIAEMAF